ncbi:protein of unknown function DUF2288 [Citrifermentans bemidjiense Bem]|uniref:DUF2288 domain-containing protein n=1 Tax=Citrifermentans bemidjiense (strain ATCC BAA-1014 / DSM 16622 / JCM 12645 / Bem) TaxID=404380 RepID=B5E8F1_CITBB|nr:DUF2288 domain-containing protein [Citrifermentans bemidjiense]ACH37134.1 protein of unknown function DUF2288 [Citrifermentans bemidjiense Bem]
MSAIKEELATKIDSTDWLSLRAHLERGGVIIVDPMLDLAEVGAAVANDEVKTVERWLLSGLLSKPSAEQIQAWDAESGKSFLCLIVSPYVLAQEERPVKG